MTTMSEYCKNIHSNPDAQAWAKFFIETLKEQGWKIEHIDEGLMIGWFANAMMAMHDHVKREWVGLTDEEILDSADAFGSFQYGDAQGHKRLEFAKAIEAKLKEKNS